jgi:hypothetical protein
MLERTVFQQIMMEAGIQKLEDQVPILPNTIFPILHIFVRFSLCNFSYKFVKNEP